MKKILLSLLFLAIPVLALAGERIYLADGRIFDGEIVKVDVKELHFKYKKGPSIESVLIFKISEIQRITRVDKEGRETEMNFLGSDKEEQENASRVPNPAPPKVAGTDMPSENASVAAPPVKIADNKSGISATNPRYLAEHEKAKKAAALAFVELAKWCESNNASELARENYRKALEFDPDCIAAGEGLGLVKRGQKWITREEAAALDAREAEAQKLADDLTKAGYVNLAGVWITSEFRKIIEDSPSNKRFSYLIILQRYKDASGISTAEFLQYDNETKSIWHYLAPAEQKRICAEMAGKKFELPAQQPKQK